MNATSATLDHQIVSNSEWLRVCGAFLAQEKELTRLSDDLARRRRELPWTPVEKEYQFDGPGGKMSLSDLFDAQSQLATYHFMFGPDWAEGCPGCTYVTDHTNGALEHLRARDVSLVLVSRAPLEKIAAFRERMGWRIPWVSSARCIRDTLDGAWAVVHAGGVCSLVALIVERRVARLSCCFLPPLGCGSAVGSTSPRLRRTSVIDLRLLIPHWNRLQSAHVSSPPSGLPRCSACLTTIS